MLLPIDSVLNGKYRVVRELGRGAMGVVYQAEHLLLGSSVAMKMLAPEFIANEQLRERFFKEARTQSTLRHPSVNRVVDYFEQDRHLLLVLEFIEGDSLTKLLHDGPLAASRCVPLITCVLEGLDYVHRQGVVHRDVKPSNVIVDPAGRAVLIDFGIAVRAGGTRLTRAGGRVGSTHYMSPEQIQAPAQLDHRTDIYAAGVVLYEMLTGQVPFDGASDYAIEQQHIHAKPPDPRTLQPSIPPHLAKAVLRALEKDPARRFQGCTAFITALTDAVAPATTPTQRDRHLAWLPGVVAVAVVIGYVAYDRRPTATPAALPGASAPPPQAASGTAPAAAVPTRPDAPVAVADIPADQVLAIESLALLAVAEMRKYCAASAERQRLQPPAPGGAARPSAGRSERLDASMQASRNEYAAKLDGLRSYPHASVAQLLAERRREATPDDARRLSAIARQVAQDQSSGPALNGGDCEGPVVDRRPGP